MVSSTHAVICDSEDGNRAHISENFAYIRSLLPYVNNWPRDASDRFLAVVFAKYFSESVAVNRFNICVLMHKAETPHDAVQSLAKEGAFSTRRGRAALLEMIADARNTHQCKKDVLDVLDDYAALAFVLDGVDITCGTFPSV
jgi:hypothetical protein